MGDFQYRWVMKLSDDTEIDFYLSQGRGNNPLTTVPGMDHSEAHYFVNAPFDKVGPGNGKIPPGLDHHPLATRHTKGKHKGWLLKKSDVVDSFAVRIIP